MKLEALIKEMDTDRVVGSTDRTILGVACDSRHIRAGYLFVAVPGVHQDGRAFIDDAVQRGASVVVTERDIRLSGDVTCVCVPDARMALARLACAFNKHPSRHLLMVGITGTNGKTTCAYTIRDILRAAGRSPGLLSTVEYQIGERAIPAGRTTPDATALQSLLAQMRGAGCDSAVMEVSSHSLVQHRVAGIDFDVGVFTNVTHDHLDYHVTLEAYFEAKRRLFLDLGTGRKHATAVVNTDDPWGRRLLDMGGLTADVVTYGLRAEAAVRAEDVRLGADGGAFRVVTPWGQAECTTPLLGRFNVYNALASIGACGVLNIPLDAIVRALAHHRRVPGRLEEVRTSRDFQVFVDYAHTSDALNNVLTTVREVTSGRLILVFGCGGNRDRAKRPEMGRVAAELADLTILTSDNPRREDPADIIAQIKAGFGAASAVEAIEDRRRAIERALSVAAQGDVVLIAGKGHESFQELANTTVPFDDRQVVKQLLGQE